MMVIMEDPFELLHHKPRQGGHSWDSNGKTVLSELMQKKSIDGSQKSLKLFNEAIKDFTKSQSSQVTQQE